MESFFCNETRGTERFACTVSEFGRFGAILVVTVTDADDVVA
jgi:hypothetical protein